jgi:ParB-like chromosome segregation protein Spo0J
MDELNFKTIYDSVALMCSEIESISNLDEKITVINYIREKIHQTSPFKNEPVDFVKWIPNVKIVANDYNPNSVAPPEMQLLEVSIINDGYTQPIVTWPKTETEVEVIDGFHRNRVGKESKEVNQRVQGYLPTVIIKKEREGKGDRIASTIRHNRARGKHAVSAMSDIVLELKKRNWSEARIGNELGMDEDEILRLCQISGLAEAFENDEFSKAWESAIHSTDIVSDVNFETTED